MDPEPIMEREPAGHVWHVDSLVAPGVIENFPDAHPMHAKFDPAKRVVLYVPALQIVQLNDTGEDHDPCVQFLHALAPSAENDPAGQDKHTLEPWTGAN